MYSLTKHLYADDEVELSLITSLLTKRDLEESYFWANELFVSGYNICETLFKVYMDFYFELNPKMECYMRNNKQYNNIIRNLFRMKPTSSVFLLRQWSMHGVPTLYRGRIPTWCRAYDKKNHQCLRAISKKEIPNAARHIYSCLDCESLFRDIVKYFELSEGVFEYWNTRKYNDTKHNLLAIVVQLLTDASKISETHKYIISNYKMNDSVIETIKPYNVLSLTRQYIVNSDIGVFKLQRRNIESTRNALRMHWEYYSYFGKYWKHIITTYGGIACDKTKKIIFPDDHSLERFYEINGYEPDEQSELIQNQSTVHITDILWYEWHKSTFHDEPIVQFEPTFVFEY